MDTENKPIENVFAFAASTNSAKAAPTPVVKPVSVAPVKGTTPMKSIATTKPATAVKTTPNKRPASATPKSTGKAVGRVPFSLATPSSGGTICSDSREAAKIAKDAVTVERMQKVAQLKEKWAKEREQKTQFYQEKRNLALQRLQEDSQLAEEHRRKNLQKKREFEERERTLKKEQLAASLEARSQLAKDLEAEAKARRRISIFLNSQMRKKAQEKEALLNTMKKEEEESLLSSRRLDALQLRDAKREEEQRKRESLCNRTLMAQEQKRIAEELEQKKREEEAALLETRKLNWEDDIGKKQKEEQERRQSIAGRIEEWRKQKNVEMEMQREQEHHELDLIHTRHADWKDVQSYKDELERRKRESLAFRLDKWREDRNLDQKSKEQEDLAREMEAELTREANEDVENYRKTQKEARRQSLAYRLDKARKDRDFEEGQKALSQMVQEEENRLNALDREDVKNYRQKILDARRQSLEYRNQTEFQERMRQEGEKQAQLVAEQADHELREKAWQDVRAYREQQRAEQRKSLAWRLADAHRKHEIDVAMHEEQLNRMHLDLQCKREDWLALQEYKKEEAERRRKSISLRVQSWKTQRLAEEKEQERREMLAEEEAILREMDREELLAAKLTQDLIDRRARLNTDMLH